MTSSLPDRQRIPSPARALAVSLVDLAVAATWRAMNPASRQRFVEAPKPRPLTRLYYDASDGWSSPLFVIPECPGGAGEPVVLAHALGMSPDVFRYGAGPTLADALSAAGYRVYLLTHRGDGASIPPVADPSLQPQSLQPQSSIQLPSLLQPQSFLQPQSRAGFCFDDIVSQDLPAALERIVDHSGFERVHYIGHGLGGQLGIAWASWSGGDKLASLTALSAAVRFDKPRTEMRAFGRAMAALPAHWRLPARATAKLASPWVDGDGDTPPERLRGVLCHATDNLPVALLQQLRRWNKTGTLCDETGLLDYLEGLGELDVPLLVGTPGRDVSALPHNCQPLLDAWGGADKKTLPLPKTWGHLDPLLHEDAEAKMFGPIVQWLEYRRKRSWQQDGERIRRSA